MNISRLSDEILDKELFRMKGSEVLELFDCLLTNVSSVKNEDVKDEFIVGIAALAGFLKCGKTKAQKLKNSGVLDSAIHQSGKKVYINKRKLSQLIEDKKI